jgi:hypothetical protein
MRSVRLIWVILFGGAVFLLSAGIGVGFLLLETGGYPSSHGFRLDGRAYRALQAAQTTKPGMHLVIKTQRALAGPNMYLETYLSKDFDPRDCVVITTRGQTIEVERYLYDQRILRPVISHRGDDPTTGYTLSTFR